MRRSSTPWTTRCCAPTPIPTRRPRARPDHRLVRLGVLLRRPLPGALQAHRDRAGAKEYLDRLPAVHADATWQRAAGADQPGRARAWPTCGRARCPPCPWTGGARFFESTKHLLDESMWELSNINEQPRLQPHRVHRDAPQGRRRALVGGPGRARRLRRGPRPDRRHPADARAEGHLRRRACTCATTCSPTSGRSRRRASSPTACWSGAVPRRRHAAAPPTWSTTCSPPGSSSSRTPRSPSCRSLFAEYGLQPASSRRSVLTYVRGLQDWQSGGHEWHMRSSRYMNKGTAGASVVSSFRDRQAWAPGRRATGPGRHALGLRLREPDAPALPAVPRRSRDLEFYMPYTDRASPHLDAARQHSEAGRAGWVCWNPCRGVCRFATSGTITSSTASICALCARDPPGRHRPRARDLTSDWLVWGTYGDDYFPAVFGHTRDMAGAKVFNDRLRAFMP